MPLIFTSVSENIKHIKHHEGLNDSQIYCKVRCLAFENHKNAFPPGNVKHNENPSAGCITMRVRNYSSIYVQNVG